MWGLLSGSVYIYIYTYTVTYTVKCLDLLAKLMGLIGFAGSMHGEFSMLGKSGDGGDYR